jgi:hypothetical protein
LRQNDDASSSTNLAVRIIRRTGSPVLSERF